MTERSTREISQRWIVEGELELTTPAALGNGDDDPAVDLPLLTDPLEGRALLTGTSLAGALRSYLSGFTFHSGGNPAVVLFGGERGDEEGGQSPLIVDDAIAAGRPNIEIRDGVSINPVTRTALDRQKYDRQLLAAGTRFPIRLELILGRNEEENRRRIAALSQILIGLQNGVIRLGGRKRRGLGQTRVSAWQGWRYDLETPQGLRAWLSQGRQEAGWQSEALIGWQGNDIQEWLPPSELLVSQRSRFGVRARFAIPASLLIRAGFEEDIAPDVTHLRAFRPGSATASPIISGTSLGGVLRAQALRIARTLSNSPDRADNFIFDLFGYMPNDESKTGGCASRVVVSEATIEESIDLVQSRVAIDRFTGGALESALFSEQPVFGGYTWLEWEVVDASTADIGLMLLVLKDLWTGMTPIGGEASVGRGRLTGLEASLNWENTGGTRTWRLEGGNEGLQIGNEPAEHLNTFVKSFVEVMGGAA